MSYGFGVGDFVAVGELCWKLYRNVVQVARDAPKEIRSLQQDLSSLSNVIKALQEDATQPGSAIAQASPDRVGLGKDLLARTEEVLRRLEKLAGKYELLQQPRDASTARPVVPSITASPYDEQAQFELSRLLMDHAELNNMRWSAIGIENWMQMGKWWLMKGSVASSLSYLSSGSQQLDVQRFSQVVKAEHVKLESRGIMKPSFDQVKMTDLTIWTTGKRTTLLPSLSSGPTDRAVFWGSGSDDILYQRFGYCTSETSHSEVECVVLLIVKAGNTVSVVAQAADGQDVLRTDTIHFTRKAENAINGIVKGPAGQDIIQIDTVQFGRMDLRDGRCRVPINLNLIWPKKTAILEFSSFGCGLLAIIEI
ncbi:hypothetical protein DL767_001781 [Monosporascus sp. MG133]|nr:hypothetical protein DL767_001781 [Monosporascus sp. MG133]